MLAVVGNSTRMLTTTIYRSSTFPTKILIPIPISGKSTIKQQINSQIKIPWPVIQIMVIGIDQVSPILTISMDMEAKYHRNSHHPTLLALRKTNPSSSSAWTSRTTVEQIRIPCSSIILTSSIRIRTLILGYRLANQFLEAELPDQNTWLETMVIIMEATAVIAANTLPSERTHKAHLQASTPKSYASPWAWTIQLWNNSKIAMVSKTCQQGQITKVASTTRRFLIL